jgi:SAM-dependent methyltransferase
VVDLPRLREFEELFGHRWEALALRCLSTASTPLQFGQLAKRMDEQSDERLADGVVTRSLRKLTEAKLVQPVTTRTRHPLYALTPAGSQKAARLNAILDALGESPDPFKPPLTTPLGDEARNHDTVDTHRYRLWMPKEADPSQPNPARVYDYLLGGTHHLEADRQHAEELTKIVPQAPLYALANRAFLQRVVRFLISAGVRQFLDIGSGIPTVGNVHDIAHASAPNTTVVYVDADPIAVAQSRLILSQAPRVGIVHADLRDIDAILDAPPVRELIDFSQPLAVLLVAVLHFVPDDVTAVLSRLHEVTAPGSYLVISQATSGVPAEAQDLSRRKQSVGLRSRAELADLFAGFALVEPGLVGVQQWRPTPGDRAAELDPEAFLAGVARRP